MVTLTLERALRAAQARAAGQRTVREILRGIDRTSFECLIEKYSGADGNRVHGAKYFDLDLYLKRNVRRAYMLGLHKANGLRILDVGSGFGYFEVVARQMGHHATGLDRPEGAGGSSELYAEVARCFRLTRIAHTMGPRVPLPDVNGTYDLITAFQITFDHHGAPWSANDWEFFLDDATTHIKPGGRLFVGLNTSGTANGSWDSIRKVFESRGAAVWGRNALFHNGVLHSHR